MKKALFILIALLLWQPVSAATLTVFPDAGSGATTVDGILNGTANAVYATIHDAANSSGAFVTDDSTNLAQNSLSGGNYSLWRGVATFDTSPLGSGSTVTATTLKLFGNGNPATDSDGDSIGIYSSNPASNNNLVTADYNKTNFGTTAYCTIGLTSWDATDGLPNTCTFNATGRSAIVVTGITKLGYRIDADAANTAPSGVNIVSAYFADHAGTTIDPTLTITYTVGGAPAASSTLLIKGASVLIKGGRVLIKG